MPAFENVLAPPQTGDAGERTARFPPVTRDHILHCSYDYWFPKYRASCLRSRIVQLPPEFIEYLQEDGIILADDGDDDEDWQPPAARPREEEHEERRNPVPDSGGDSDDEDSVRDRPARLAPNRRFPGLHERIEEEIRQLGGKVVPKLNWSSPKDATWIMMDKNTMACTCANDVYLLLKSSSFISHDLEHAFDGCTSPNMAPSSLLAAPPGQDAGLGFSPVLVLRPYFTPQPALEFRCFVKQRSLVAISQRDLKYYPFLDGLRHSIVARAKQLFDAGLRLTFPDGCFTFDVYIPEGGSSDHDHEQLSRARLIDINPWAPRTDALLFDWEELLDLGVPSPVLGTLGEGDTAIPGCESESEASEATDNDDDEVGEFEPELRLIDRDDPIASNFLSSQYSAHKLPKEVVDASAAGGAGLREFAEQWKQMIERGSGRA